MSYRLPPLHTLRLFESAGRQLSFKAAAKELGVTPSAVSHGVQTLEDWLGAPLFHRSRRGISLTSGGETYLPAVANALALLAGAASQLTSRGKGQRLHISAAPTFASRILLPRLQRFRDRQPEIDVSIDTNHRLIEFPRDGADVAIRLGHGNWPGLRAMPLLTEILVPVCSPSLRERLGTEAAMDDAPIIHVTLASQDWQAWSGATGVPISERQRILKVDTIQMAWEAAAEGLGVAIGRRPLIDRELASGELVTCSSQEIASNTRYWLVAPPDAFVRTDVSAFYEWLIEELAPMQQRLGETGLLSDDLRLATPVQLPGLSDLEDTGTTGAGEGGGGIDQRSNVT